MLPSVNTSRWPFTAPSVPASTFSATHGVRNPLIRNFIPVKVKSGAGVTLIWHWLHVNPVCRTNAGTRASATCATTPSAANTTATLSHRIFCLLNYGYSAGYHPLLLLLLLLLQLLLLLLLLLLARLGGDVTDQGLDVRRGQLGVVHLDALIFRHQPHRRGIACLHLFRVLEPLAVPRSAPTL